MGLNLDGPGSEDRHPPLGRLLRQWRASRGMSQLDLSLEAGVSARHLSCVETGKAQASRELIARLADALDMPLRERNALIVAAGFAPQFTESPLVSPTLERMRGAIDLILAHQEPYPAFVISRHWEVLHTNAAAGRMNQFLMQGRPSRHTNMLHQVFDPEDFRSVIVNWTEVAGRFLRQLHDDMAAAPSDATARRLLDEVLDYPDVPARWRLRDPGREPSPIVNLVLRGPLGEARFFETITTFAGPRDVTLEELRIECCYPVDDATAALCERLRAG